MLRKMVDLRLCACFNPFQDFQPCLPLPTFHGGNKVYQSIYLTFTVFLQIQHKSKAKTMLEIKQGELHFAEILLIIKITSYRMSTCPVHIFSLWKIVGLLSWKQTTVVNIVPSFSQIVQDDEVPQKQVI